jgi:rRNA-processing protein FCF1
MRFATVQLKRKQIAQWAEASSQRMSQIARSLARLKQRSADIKDENEMLTASDFVIDDCLLQELRKAGEIRVQHLRQALASACTVRFRSCHVVTGEVAC